MSYRADHLFSKQELEDSIDLNIDVLQLDGEDLVSQWHKTLKTGMHGICFSMYEDGQEPGDQVSREQVERRIKILKPYTRWIRSFSCIEGNEFVPEVAKAHGLKTMVGAWLSDDVEANEIEINALIKLANEGMVDIAAVGNEVLYRNELEKKDLIRLIERVKAAIPSDIPVGYVDAYYEFTVHPDLAEVCDVILSNCYPYWEGCPNEYALNHMNSMYHQALEAGKGKKVIVTETGWPSKGGSLRGAVAGDQNAIRYFIQTHLWARQHNIETFYFSSFDESWKTGDEGDVGAYWGLWDKNENLKF
ncbi:MAG: glycosyl hydrolase family 17 protein [Nonlabens sp.]